MTVKQLLSEMDSDELSEWIAYDKDYHLPDGFWQTGMISSTIANCHRDSKRKPQPFEPSDFMPQQRSRAMSEQELQTMIEIMFGSA